MHKMNFWISIKLLWQTPIHGIYIFIFVIMRLGTVRNKYFHTDFNKFWH